MPKNEKCFKCQYLTEKGILITQVSKDREGKPIDITESKPNYFCSHKQINLNNIIVKNCSSSHPKHKEFLDSPDEFTPSEVFKDLPPQQKRINFFR